MSSTTATEAVPSTNVRATGGRFAKNNPGGPGNPFARQTAALRAYLIILRAGRSETFPSANRRNTTKEVALHTDGSLGGRDSPGPPLS